MRHAQGLRLSVLDQLIKARRKGNKGLGFGTSLRLNEPEPWGEPIQGEDLLDNLVSTFVRHLALGDGYAEVMAFDIRTVAEYTVPVNFTLAAVFVFFSCFAGTGVISTGFASFSHLIRDSSTKEVSYFGQGAFKVRWVKTGDAVKSGQIVFFRRTRTANMFSIVFDKKTLEFTVRGAYINTRDARKLEAMGLNMQGVLRIKTDGRVVTHNANRVTKQGPITLYGWRIKSLFDGAPKIVIAVR